MAITVKKKHAFFKKHLASWYPFYLPLIKTKYATSLLEFIAEKKEHITPKMSTIFKSYRACNINDFKVLFPDIAPYPTPGDANGFAYGASSGRIPETLRLIKEELNQSFDLGDLDTTLIPWAKQGVLLMNLSLTTEHRNKNAHGKIWKPWRDFTYKRLNESTNLDCVYLHLGLDVQKMGRLVHNRFIVNAPHPISNSFSSDSGFVGSDCFKRVNSLLETPIKWI